MCFFLPPGKCNNRYVNCYARVLSLSSRTENTIFSFFCQKNRFDEIKILHFYFGYKMAISDDTEQSKVQDTVVAVNSNTENPEEPLSKFKVCSWVYSMFNECF